MYRSELKETVTPENPWFQQEFRILIEKGGHVKL